MMLRVQTVICLHLLPVIIAISDMSSVLRPPSMLKEPPSEQLYQVIAHPGERDKPFTLECEASGNPEPTYNWTKNGKDFNYVSYDNRISQQPRRGTLVFTKPEDIDEGLYQCFATNSHGVSVSNAVFLRKSELRLFPISNVQEKHVTAGDVLTLECNPPTGYPKPKIFWLTMFSSGALHIINSSRLTTDPEGNLHFSSVRKEDMLKDGYYACIASSVFRSEYKIGNTVNLIVDSAGSSEQSSRAPTKQYVSPPQVVALRGRVTRFSCIFGGNPLPEIVWRKKERTALSSRYTYDHYGKTLEIKSTDFEDEGTYECTASNGVGKTQTHAMTLSVEAAPYWIVAPNNTNSADDETVIFECTASGIPEPRLQWFMNGVPIEKVRGDHRRTIKGNVMTIVNLTKADTAVFQCNASNENGYAFRDFYLNVLALKPTITKPPLPLVRVVVTATVLLQCEVFGAPKPDVKWFRDGQELTGGRFQILEDGHLQINGALVTDQGEYTCRAKNKHGHDKQKGRLEVKGKTKIIQPPKNFEIEARKPVTFRCNADADPSLSLRIIWKFNEEPIDFDQDTRKVNSSDNSLTITETTELDSGIYTCFAKTELDYDEAHATLTVQDIPNPPKIMRVTCDKFIASVEWQPMGDRRAPIFTFIIQQNTSFTPDTWNVAFPDIPATDKEITNININMSETQKCKGEKLICPNGTCSITLFCESRKESDGKCNITLICGEHKQSIERKGCGSCDVILSCDGNNEEKNCAECNVIVKCIESNEKSECNKCDIAISCNRKSDAHECGKCIITTSCSGNSVPYKSSPCKAIISCNDKENKCGKCNVTVSCGDDGRSGGCGNCKVAFSCGDDDEGKCGSCKVSFSCGDNSGSDGVDRCNATISCDNDSQ